MCLFGFCIAVIISLSSLHVCYIHALCLMLSKFLYVSQKGYLLFPLQHVSFHFKFLTLHTLSFWFFVNECVYLMVKIYLLTLSSSFIHSYSHYLWDISVSALLPLWHERSLRENYYLNSERFIFHFFPKFNQYEIFMGIW